MKNTVHQIGCFLVLLAALLILGGCNSGHGDLAAEAPPPATVVPDVNVGLFSVEHPEQFPLATAEGHAAAPQLVVTGTVNPDVARAWRRPFHLPSFKVRYDLGHLWAAVKKTSG
jgi:hypothetical protein